MDRILKARFYRIFRREVKMDLKMNKFFTILLSFFLLLCIFACEPVPKPQPPSGSTLKIRVLDKVTTQGIPNARVSLTKDSKPLGGEKVTDGQGEVQFKDVDPADGYIAFINNAQGYKSSASPVIKVVEGETESNVLLDRISNGAGNGLIVGSVKDDTSKQPISRLTVNCFGNGANLSTFTDENGSYLVEGLLPGTYTVSYLRTGYVGIKKSIKVANGVPTNIETIFLKRQAGVSTSGNMLVSLSGQRRVVEIDNTGKIVWSYTNLGSIENSSRISTGDTLITDGSASKVIQVSSTGSVVKSLGSGLILSSFKYPSWVDSVDGNNVLITDNGANKVFEFTAGKQAWSYSTGLLRPRSSVYSKNGNVLIADTGNKRVVEVNKQGQIVWSFDQSMDKPVHAVRTASGNTLITDSGLSRVIEVSPKGQVVWWYAGNNQSSGGGGNNPAGNTGNFLGDLTPNQNQDPSADTTPDDGTGDLPSIATEMIAKYPV
jgi:hypothetical protein